MEIFIILCVIALIVIVPILIIQTNKFIKNKKKMEAAGPVIARLSKLAKDKLMQNGIVDGYQDYSTAGYEYFEYKDKYNYEDNIHLILDKKSRQIAHYMLIPFCFDPAKQYSDLQYFSVHSFDDLVKVELNTGLGDVKTTSVGTGVGTNLGGVGVGIGSSNGVSTQLVTSLSVCLYFRDGSAASCNFLNNRTVSMGGEVYKRAHISAKMLLNICEMIIKENNENT